MIEKILIHDHLNDICEEVRRMLNGKNYQGRSKECCKMFFEKFELLYRFKVFISTNEKTSSYKKTTENSCPRLYLSSRLSIDGRY
jgi:hypothetical protein